MFLDILYETTPHHTRAALFSADGRLLMLHIDDINRPLRDGTIVLGRVRKLTPGLNAAFVDIGDHHDGFLRLNTLPKELKTLTEGQAILTRITRAADLAKGAKLDARVAIPMPVSTTPPEILQHPPTALQRVLHDANDTPIRCWVNTEEDKAYVSERIPEDKIFICTNHPDVDLYEKLQAALDQMQTGDYTVSTPFGPGKLTVEVTKALTAIDLDAANLTGNRKEAVKAVNLTAAIEVARLCKLQDLGGNVIVDFITMSNPHHRKQVTETLREAFARTDMAKVEVRPMSPHGIVEINRERTGAMLPELLSYPHIVAGEILLTLQRNTLQYLKVKEVFVEAHPNVVNILKQRLTRSQALEQYGRPITYLEKPAFPEARYILST